jgi:uncharacterized protein Usg
LLQLYVWQEYDLAPHFPELKGFLGYWERELEGAPSTASLPSTEG